MYYLSKAIVFIACLITACTVNWWAGVIALGVAVICGLFAAPKGGAK
jgi:hypothetical protein